MDIVSCGRTVTGDLVAFDIAWDGDAAEDADLRWSMVVSSGAEEDVVELGHARSGETSTQYVADRSSARRHEVDADADLRDHEITVRFPAQVVGVAREWPMWKAVLRVDGAVVAEQVLPVS